MLLIDTGFCQESGHRTASAKTLHRIRKKQETKFWNNSIYNKTQRTTKSEGQRCDYHIIIWFFRDFLYCE